MALRSDWKSSKEEVVASNGVVTAMQPSAAEAGLHMLKSGGNAVDAAVAVGFCNVVLEPYMACIGGMGYMLVHMAETGCTVGIDFNGRAPRQADATMFEVLGPAAAGGINVFRTVDDANVDGPLSITVPATAAGFCEAHARFGVLPLAQVLEPAISLAHEGFESDWHTTLYVANKMAAFAADPYLAGMWLPGGRPPRSFPKPADRIIQRDLADLLRRIASEGAAGMYAGEVADAIDMWMRNNAGVLSRDDLAAYQPALAEPLSLRFRDVDIACVNTPSGSITKLQAFALLDRFPLGELRQNSPEYLHLVVEAARHAFADRYRFLGDWEHADVPLNGLLSAAYATHVAALIEKDRTGTAISGDAEPWSYYLDRTVHDPWLFEPGEQRAASPEAALESHTGQTTHINVVDKDRNAVSCTHTGVFGAVHPAGTGAYLTGGMAWFNPLPGYANSIAGWKRPMNNMCPTMVLRDGRPIICQGAPGARRIIHRGIQVLLNLIDHGMSPQAAVSAPTLDASGNAVLLDSRLPESTVAALQAKGHVLERLEEEPGMTGHFARPSVVTVDYEKGLLTAGVDSFRPAIALGY